MKKAVKAVIIVAAVAAVAGGAYLRFKPGQASATSNVTTSTVQRGTLSATLTASGNIQAHQSAELSFGQSGTVKSIGVSVGDHVKKGDVLAELDTANLELSLRSAEVSLKNAQDSLAQTKNPNTEQDLADARVKLDAAKASYDSVKAGATAEELSSGLASLNSAKAAYDAAVASANTVNTTLASAAASLEKARVTLQQAQTAYDKVSWKADIGTSSESQTLQSATIDYNSAKATYDAAMATADSDTKSKIASAAASLKSAQDSYQTLKDKPTQSDLAAAQSTLTQAQNALDTLLAGPTAVTVDISQNSVDSAQIALDQAKLNLEEAKLVAPFDGVITAVDIKVGQASASPAFTIADLDNLEIQVSMSEVDVNKVQAGQEAEITLDAVENGAFVGKVTSIAPAGTTTSGVVSYPVVVGVTTVSDTMKTGMTANLNLIISKKDNVLLVPNKAVKTVNKQKVVTVMFEGQQIQTPVTTGLSNDSSTEIVSGLREGDVVVLTGATTTSSSSSRGGMGGMGGMGGPPPGGM